jgi:outer membrane protein
LIKLTGEKTMMKAIKCVAGLALAGFLLTSAAKAHAADGPKIGYMDMQKAIQETSAGKKAKKDLEKEFTAKKGELQKREADLKKMDEDLRKKASALSDEVRTKKMQELQTEAMKFQREVGESQVTIQKKERDLTQPIIEKLQVSLEKIAKEGGYTMILEKSEQSVLWAKKDLDLTDSVVKEFEKTAEKPAASAK